MTDMTESDRKAFDVWCGQDGGHKNHLWELEWGIWQAAITHARGKQGDESKLAQHHAVELEQCAIFAADVGGSIAKAMTDASAFLRSAYAPPAESEELARLRAENERFRRIVFEIADRGFQNPKHTAHVLDEYVQNCIDALAASPALVVERETPNTSSNAVCGTQTLNKPKGDDPLKVLEDEGWDLRCVNVPTGGDDYDVEWHVISHWMAKPRERIEGFGNTPKAALDNALAVEDRRILSAIEGGEDE